MTLKDIVGYLYFNQLNVEKCKCVILVEDATDDKFEYVEELFTPDNWSEDMIIHVAINL